MTRVTLSIPGLRFYKTTIDSLQALDDLIDELEERVSDMEEANEIDLYDAADLHSLVDNLILLLRVLASEVTDEDLPDAMHVELMEKIAGYLVAAEDFYEDINEFMDDILNDSDAKLGGISEAFANEFSDEADEEYLSLIVSIEVGMPAEISIDGDPVTEDMKGDSDVLRLETDLDSALEINGVPIRMDLPEENSPELVTFFVPCTAAVTVNGAVIALAEGENPEDTEFVLRLSKDDTFTVNGTEVTLRELTVDDEDDEA